MRFPFISYCVTIGIVIMTNDEGLSMDVRGEADVAFRRTIEDVSTLKALADPIRLQLLDITMAEPERTWTARELATLVGILPTNIYYHVNMLERHGLLKVRETRIINGIIEKHYGAAQQTLNFYRRAGEAADDAYNIISEMLNQMRTDIESGLALGTMSLSSEAPDPKRMLVSRTLVSIPEDRIDDFRQDMLSLAAKYEGAPAGAPFTIMVAIYPS
ncbi:MAG TPA: ArsR family transcriptional regulator [Micromonosporaceae bacterium]|nr:ArsR family transcriptional regulator [Micromonosporaceae bacterium]HCU48865.1 ArsR family transcriptional regulator [Micromonosporaceae bacterium]